MRRHLPHSSDRKALLTSRRGRPTDNRSRGILARFRDEVARNLTLATEMASELTPSEIAALRLRTSGKVALVA